MTGKMKSKLLNSILNYLAKERKFDIESDLLCWRFKVKIKRKEEN